RQHVPCKLIKRIARREFDHDETDTVEPAVIRSKEVLHAILDVHLQEVDAVELGECRYLVQCEATNWTPASALGLELPAPAPTRVVERTHAWQTPHRAVDDEGPLTEPGYVFS